MSSRFRILQNLLLVVLLFVVLAQGFGLLVQRVEPLVPQKKQYVQDRSQTSPYRLAKCLAGLLPRTHPPLRTSLVTSVTSYVLTDRATVTSISAVPCLGQYPTRH